MSSKNTGNIDSVHLLQGKSLLLQEHAYPGLHCGLGQLKLPDILLCQTYLLPPGIQIHQKALLCNPLSEISRNPQSVRFLWIAKKITVRLQNTTLSQRSNAVDQSRSTDSPHRIYISSVIRNHFQ